MIERLGLNKAMIDTLARNWGWLALRGVAALLFGVLAILYPGITLSSMILMFGIYAIVDGGLTAFAAVANRKGERRWVPLLVGGLLSVAIGIATLVAPGVTAVVLLAMIATWAIVTGAAEMFAAIKLRKVIRNEWALGLAGALAVLFGIGMLMQPGAGALAVVFWIALFAITSGILQLMFGFKLRRWGKQASPA